MIKKQKHKHKLKIKAHKNKQTTEQYMKLLVWSFAFLE